MARVQLSLGASKRLLWDWKEVQAEPLATVEAAPLESNLGEWHCNLRPADGPYAGGTFHLVLTFPANYPDAPPDVRPCTYLQHPNVFGHWICLDMIKPSSYYQQRYRGWSSAYSVQSVLLQLQSFLFAENVPQDYGGSTANVVSRKARQRALSEAAAFRCAACSHSGSSAIQRPGDRQLRSLTPRVLGRPGGPRYTNVLGIEVRHRATTPDDTPPTRAPAAPSSQLPTPPQPRAPTPRSPLQPRATAPVIGTSSRVVGVVTAVPEGADGLSSLEDDVLVAVMERLPGPALASLLTCSRRLAQVATSHGVWLRRQLVCFHSKLPWTDDVLGLCLNVTNPGPRGRFECEASLDLLSRTSFFARGVRKGVWNEPCNWWLPAMLDEHHTERALSMLRGVLAGLATPSVTAPSSEAELLRLSRTYTPAHALKVLPRIMNGMVVGFMKEQEQDPLGDGSDYQEGFGAVQGCTCPQCTAARWQAASRATPQKKSYDRTLGTGAKKERAVELHASERALVGYCRLHHALLALAKREPELQRRIDVAVDKFLRSPGSRVKTSTPDLGEFLVLLSACSAATWRDLAWPFLQEVFDRNVLWLLREREELAFVPDEEVRSGASPEARFRLSVTWDATATSRRLVMFQVAFLLLVRPEGSLPEDVLAAYALRQGYPKPGLTTQLQTLWYAVLKVATWPAFFRALGLQPPTESQTAALLRDALRRSAEKGYHRQQSTDRRLRALHLERLKQWNAATKGGGTTGEAGAEKALEGLHALSETIFRARGVLGGGGKASGGSRRRNGEVRQGRVRQQAQQDTGIACRNSFGVLAEVE